jgi:hypothetical protein
MAFELSPALRASLTENLGLKALSLVVALVLYSLAHASQAAQRSLMVNVVALTPSEPSSRELVTPIPAQVRVTVRGPQSMLDDLHADDLGSLQLDLREGAASRVTFEPSMIAVQPGLTVAQIDPPAVDLRWEERVTRDVPAEVGIVGSPAPGFMVKGVPKADPVAVRVSGPKSEVMVVQRVRADAFDVSGLTQGRYTRQLAIERPTGRLHYDVLSVSASLEIGREEAERPFSRIPVAVLGHASAKLQPAEVDVHLTCPPEILRALRPEQIVPKVRVASPAEHGSDALPVQLAIDSCEVHVTPPTVVVRW